MGKSAVGIGALLLDGLGDTMRVSLTEDPEFEAHPTNALRRVAENGEGGGVSNVFDEPRGRREGHFARRTCDFPIDVPLNTDGSVLATLSAQELHELDISSLCQQFGLHLRADGDIQ